VLLSTVVSVQRTEAQGLAFPLFERYLESFRIEAGIPGISALVIQNGIVVWERGLGRRDVEAGAPSELSTPYIIGGLSETFGATLLLRKCVDQWGAQLDDPVVLRNSTFPEPLTTLRQLLSHTAPGGAGFVYSPSRFASLTSVVERCAQQTYAVALNAEIFDRFAMLDSAPDQVLGTLPTAGDAGLFDAGHMARYADVAGRLATAYRITSGKPQRNNDIPARRVDASDGIISSARDLAKFDNALLTNALLAAETRNTAWTQALANGAPLQTGLGWFVQNYHDEPIVWQFGMTRGGHSALIIKAPNRGLTFIALANSDGLTAPFALESGDLTKSPFATLFLRLFLP
jgi:CubicO group peptidase (beta-lactamase class C family)